MTCRVSTTALFVCALAACGSKPPPAPVQPAPLSESAYTHYLRGRLAAFEGEPTIAAHELGLAAQAAPGEPEIVVAYIEALANADRKEDAVRVSRRAIEQWPKRADVNFAAGRAHRKQLEHALAIQFLKRAIEIDPEIDEAHTELALAYTAAGQPERAAAAYRELVRLQPNKSQPRIRLARLLLESGHPRDAETTLDELLEERPAHVRARLLHHQVLIASDRVRDATESLRAGFLASSSQRSFARRVFEAMMKNGDHQNAEHFVAAIEAPGLSSSLRLFLGRLLIRIGRSQQALGIAQSVLAKKPKNTSAATLAGIAHAQSRNYARAAAATRGARLTRSSRVLVIEWLALAAKESDARTLAAELEASDPQRAYLEARIEELSRSPQAARALFEAAQLRWPEDLDLLFEIASFELRQGNAKRAVEIADQILSKQPENPDLQNFVGFALAEAGVDLERADRLLAAAQRHYPGDANILDSVGWLRFRQGKPGRAAETLRLAWRLAPTQPEILFHLAQAEEALGRKVAARKLFSEAYDLASEPTLRDQIKVRAGL